MISWITNKWLRFGVPLVRCGDCLEAAHGKFSYIFSKQKQSLITISSKYVLNEMFRFYSKTKHIENKDNIAEQYARSLIRRNMPFPAPSMYFSPIIELKLLVNNY